MLRQGSDKSYHSHNYTTVYSVLFADLRNRPLRVFELGLGSNNSNMPFHMGVNGKPGASLRGWREIFPNAQVFGADIDREALFQEHRIKTFYCDQLSRSAVNDLWSNLDMQVGADIIIEDGLHTFVGNISFLEGSLEHLRPGGIYVIEDICQNTAEEWFNKIDKDYRKRYPTYEFVFVSLPTYAGVLDNNLLVIRRQLDRRPDV
jgi:SAM-dependent methyltransferase